MEFAAITHFSTKNYCYAIDPHHFRIRIAVKKGDIAKIICHYRDKYLPLTIRDTRQTKEMVLASCDGYRDYFEVDLTFDVVCLRYFFEIIDTEGKRIYYSNYTFFEEIVTDTDRMFDCPENLREEERFLVPEWAKNKVVYQIFPARFATDKDIPEEEWYVAPIGRDNKIGGNLRGIINKLPYLKELGVDVVYMCPIFLSNTIHKYNIFDYFKIDPEFGTKEDLQELTAKAHALGMKVVLDGVFNHTGIEFFAFKDVMEKGAASAYYNWYYIKGWPLIMERGKIPNYKTFSYGFPMPKLNFQNKEVQDYVCSVGTYWIREAGIDGWRLDVGDEVVHEFWKKFRKEVRKVNPEALIIGEIWHYAGDFLEGDEWDSVMNYPFSDAVRDLLIYEIIDGEGFLGRLGFLKGNLNEKVIPVLWNHLDTHDTPRFLHLADNDTTKQRIAAAFQLLLPGMPFVYYGDEVGIQGGQDPDCRRGMLWDPARQNVEMLAWYKALIRARHRYPVITEGDLVSEKALNDRKLILIERASADEKVLILFNYGENAAELSEYKGVKDLITESEFDGVLAGRSAAVLALS